MKKMVLGPCSPLDSQTLCISDVSQKQLGKKAIEILQNED